MQEVNKCEITFPSIASNDFRNFDEKIPEFLAKKCKFLNANKDIINLLIGSLH